MDPETALLAQARTGSRDAFCELMRLHQAQVHAYLGRAVRSRDIVDDLAQETFLKAYRSLAAFKGDSTLRVWLLGIARNEVLMYLRAEGRRRAREAHSMESSVASWLAGRLESDSPSPAEYERRVGALEDCIRKLPEHSAGILADYYFKGRSAEDIARLTGKRKGTVCVTLFRIRLALRECIELRLAAPGAKP